MEPGRVDLSGGADGGGAMGGVTDSGCGEEPNIAEKPRGADRKGSTPRQRAQPASASGRLRHVCGVEALFSGVDLELDFLSFSQGLESFALKRGKMNKHILLAAFRCDETISLLIAKPLNAAFSHLFSTFFVVSVSCLWLAEVKNREQNTFAVF